MQIKDNENKRVERVEKTDHRVRTGAIRREQTRLKLLTTALTVFAERGLDAPLIDDFVAAAGVSRGTFYNHFRSPRELLAAVTAEMSDEAVAVIDATVLTFDDPLERVANGCLMFMHMAIDQPAWGQFFIRAGLSDNAKGKLAEDYLERDLELARKAGRADFPTPAAACDLILGCMMRAIQSVLLGKAPPEHLRQSLELMFRGIGVPANIAHALSQTPLPDLPLPDGIAFSHVERIVSAK